MISGFKIALLAIAAALLLWPLWLPAARAEDNAPGIGALAGARDNLAGYSLRPPPLSAPSGAPGAVRRTIMQFYDWTLICDATAAEKKQICNVSQALWDSQNAVVFSWSLAASDKGEPFMLLRTAPDTDIKTPLRLAVSGAAKVIALDFVGCNDALCMAQTPVGPVLTRAIGNEGDIAVSYRTASKGMLQFSLPLRGLKAAVAAIK